MALQLLSSDLLRDHECGLFSAHPYDDKVWFDWLQDTKFLTILPSITRRAHKVVSTRVVGRHRNDAVHHQTLKTKQVYSSPTKAIKLIIISV